MEYIALDVHKRYTWARVETAQGRPGEGSVPPYKHYRKQIFH